MLVQHVYSLCGYSAWTPDFIRPLKITKTLADLKSMRKKWFDTFFYLMTFFSVT